MNDSRAKTTKSSFLWQFLIVAIVSVSCFLLGGGWHLDINDFHPHRAQGDDFLDDIFSYAVLFYYRGGAAAVAGGALAVIILFVIQKRKTT